MSYSKIFIKLNMKRLVFVLSFKTQDVPVSFFSCSLMFTSCAEITGYFSLLLLSCSEVEGQIPAQRSFIAGNEMHRSTIKRVCYLRASPLVVKKCSEKPF